MEPGNGVARWLRAVWPAAPAVPRGEARPFVTISRQAGAGGHSLAAALIEAMEEHPRRDLFAGWRVVSRDICGRLASDPRFKVSKEDILLERFRSVTGDLLAGFLTGDTPHELVLAEMFRLVRRFAQEGRVIVVGRGGACLTRDLPGGVHVRLVGSAPRRIERLAAALGLAHDAAAAELKRRDANRRRLLRDHFGKDADDALLYDVVWNTDHVHMEDCARNVLMLVEGRADRLVREREAAASPT